MGTRTLRTLLVVPLVLLVFIYGVFVGLYKIFPYDVIRSALQPLYHSISANDDYSQSDETFAITQDSNGQIREKTEWMQFTVKAANTEKKRVLFVGDSIVNQYYDSVCDRLTSYSCAKFTTSASIVNEDFSTQLNFAINAYEYEYVFFNNGLHGFGHSDDDYETNLKVVVSALAEKYEGKLALVESTPVDESLGEPVFLKSRNTRIDLRNQVIRQLALDYTLPLNPLHAVVTPKQGDFSDAYHHTPQGVKKLSNAVYEFAASVLGK